MTPYNLTVILTLVFSVYSVAADTLTVMVTDNSGQVLPDAIVYLQPKSEMKVLQTPAVEIEQKNRLFNPFISVIPVGTTATFPNHDGIGHHVYSFSEAKSFELPLSEEVLTREIIFDKPGVVTVGCNIHDWMVAYLYIVTTPYYTVTDNNGNAELPDITAGEYELHIWHPGAKDTETIKSLTIGQGNRLQEEFTLEIRPAYFWKPAAPPEIEQQEY
ncbi:MAG: methylamine utilization protein [Gammaproteobacteria bacterium]|nr:methylamine utilization protein [Gammaproteobacteria bacterium]